MKITLNDQFVDTETLPYRQGVIGIVVDDEKNFLVVQMLDYGENDWRFPGGGVDDGEELETALLREFEEELGNKDFEILKKSSHVNEYDWPESVIQKSLEKRGKAYRGQQQSQFLVRFTGKKSELNPDPFELRQIKWIKYDDLKDHFTFPEQWALAEKALEDLLA